MQVEIPKLLDNQYIFPDPKEASEHGLLAWGGDLSPKRLISAYRSGIFPWYSKGDPLLWWSPNPRLILIPSEFRVTKSLKKSRKKFSVKFNSNFSEVILKCSSLRKDTWITKEMIRAYETLHVMGYAKSVECYEEDILVGGLYGVQIGSLFCGESMFSLVRDASKVALWSLCEVMIKNGGSFIDCQMPTDHLKSLGAKEVYRDKFLKELESNRDKEVKLF